MKYIIFTDITTKGWSPLLKYKNQRWALAYRIILWIIFFLSFSTFALASSIGISTNSQEYNIDDTVQLIIEIENDGTQNGELQITGIEDNFHIVWQSQSSQRQNINGEVQQKQYFNIAMLAHESGEYNLGPVILTYEDGNVVTSNKVNIEITGERIMVNPNLPYRSTPVSNTWGQELDTGVKQTQDLSKIQLWNKSQQSNTEKDILWIHGEVMTDIYDIRPNILPQPWNILWVIFAIVGTILIYSATYLWNIFHSPGKAKIKKSINYAALLKKLEKKHTGSSTEIFYGQLGQLFRGYLDDKISYGLSWKSLAEAKKILPKELHTLYSDIYFPAYNTKPDTLENRSKIISKLRKIFRKK